MLRLTIAALLLTGPAMAQDLDARADALISALSDEDPLAVSRADGNEAEASIAAARVRIQSPVRSRLAKACARLYAANPDGTITNPLCYEVFLTNGLPD